MIQPNGIDAELVTSTDGVRWSVPQRLNPRRMPLAWMPETTLGRMLADYIGVSWSRGRPLVVYALASPPKQDEFRQAIYAAKGEPAPTPARRVASRGPGRSRATRPAGGS